MGHLIWDASGTGVVPSHFKKARVAPVPKSRATSYDDVSNYRPISQLPFISKVCSICPASIEWSSYPFGPDRLLNSMGSLYQDQDHCHGNSSPVNVP